MLFYCNIRLIAIVFSFILLNGLLSTAYLVIIDRPYEPGTVIFDASLNSNEIWMYNIDVQHSPRFVYNLLYINVENGKIILKKILECDNISYPNIFTFYLELSTNSYQGVNFYRMPISIIVNGTNCQHQNSRSKDRVIIPQEYFTWDESFVNFIVRSSKVLNIICLKQFQQITNLKSLFPRSIRQFCKIIVLDINDKRFKIDNDTLILLANENIYFERNWELNILYGTKCHLKQFGRNHSRLRIFYNNRLTNEKDAKRMRRELKNLSPHFEQVLYVSSVLEEQSADVSVITVQAHDPENSPVTYSMVPLLDSRTQPLFTIDSYTGLVLTTMSLDRELIDVHYFRVIATDDSFPPRTGTTTLQINVLDCNDHSPNFEMEQFSASISESSPIGSTVVIVRATDGDIAKNAELEYYISYINEVGTELIKTSEKVFHIDSLTGTIITKLALDRETTEFYTVIVVAVDSPKLVIEKRSATVSVLIKILDENDNYPQFDQRIYSIQVEENVWDNKFLTKITATDSDDANNAALRYSIIGGNTQSHFTIDSITGTVSLIKPLDYEAINSFRLIIRAQDGGIPSKTNTTQLLINVIDVNDNAPKFYISQYQESISENIPIGHNVIRVQAYDADEGSNAEIAYQILSHREEFPFEINKKAGWIQTTTQLDREKVSQYSFEVIAADNGDPKKSAIASVVILIQDVNDNDPVFLQKYYEVEIEENFLPGSSVITITAADQDENPKLQYEIIAGNTRNRFAINVQNDKGIITVAQPLDYRLEKRYVLTVSVADYGGRTDTANVNINVSDVNNFAPVFENAPYSVSIFEDVPIGSTVLVVSATDEDVGINAQITYSLHQDDLSENLPFAVSGKTGAIVTTNTLDRESVSGYLLTIVAYDGGKPKFSDTTDAEITIMDVNDNAPIFTETVYKVSIPENALIGTSVIRLYASDIDIGLNGHIEYFLDKNDMAENSFTIELSSGILRTNKILDRETVPVYHLTLIACDKGTPRMSSSVEIQIKLEDVNDTPPSFSADKLFFFIDENSPIGSVVGDVSANDDDEGENAAIIYSIVGGIDANYFSLVNKQGSESARLITMIELDYESNKKTFEIIIRASNPPLRSDVTVEIFVTDINDNAPILKDFQITFNNYAGHFPTGVIGNVPAVDADVNDKLLFKILMGNNANLVQINSSTGAITLSPQLNTNVPRNAMIELSVFDGINEVRATMQLIVRLITEEMLFNSVSIRLNDMSEEAFLSPLLNNFLDGLSAIIPCPKENIYVFSIKGHSNSRELNVSFSAMMDINSDQFYTSQYLHERIYLNRDTLTQLATIEVLPFDDNLCVQEPCLNFEQCLTVLRFENVSDFIHSDIILFRSVFPINTFICHCPDGFTGSKEQYLCDTEVDLCFSNPCKHNGICQSHEGGYTCICKANFTGNFCEIPILGFENCQFHNCEGSVCNLNEVSVNSISLTPTCELKSRSFQKGSFIIFDGIHKRNRFNITLRFTTIELNGLLFYNGRYNHLHDFMALEIINGYISFTYSVGDINETVIVQTRKKITDGLWHKVEILYSNRTATLIIDNCDQALSLRGISAMEILDCTNQTTLMLDKSCASPTESCHRFFDLTGPFQLGGLPSLDVEFPVNFKDFVGCISDLFIDNAFVNLDAYVFNNGTISGCPQKAVHCTSDPCFNGGVCMEGWNAYICDCPEGFSGRSCQESIPLPWRFFGNSELAFNPLLRSIQLPLIVSFSIRTWQNDTIIMQMQYGQNSSIVIELNSGVLSINYESKILSFSEIYISEGSWHRLEIKWDSFGVELVTDYGQRTKYIPILKKIVGQYIGKVLIGYQEGMQEYTLPNFKGCIQDVRVGTEKNLLNNPIMRRNVEDGCASKAQCSSKCSKNSICVTDWDMAYCECTSGYLGSDCISACVFNPCKNGVCHLDTSNKKAYRCDCNTTANYGEYCENKAQVNCPIGWWGQDRCGPCNCHHGAGYNLDCNKITGQCYCKDNYYHSSNKTICLPCECYIPGSFSNNCDPLTGQCPCRNSVIGRRCDSCSNPYAEVTSSGCQVVYDSCPRSFSSGIWWERTSLEKYSIQKCPASAKGNASRYCNALSGKWEDPDTFNCTSQSIFEVQMQFEKLRKSGNYLNAFTCIKLISDLKQAVEAIVGIEGGNKKNIKTSAIHKLSKLGVHFGEHVVRVSIDELYGNDIVIIQNLLSEIINYEVTQFGLNLSHSQDKNFIKNVIFSANEIFRKKYRNIWKNISKRFNRSVSDFIYLLNKYMKVLVQSEQDTYVGPFEIVQNNMIFAVDVTHLRLPFHHKLESSNETYHSTHLHQNQVLLDGSQYIVVPKYDNYLQDDSKFDKISKISFPLNIIGINTSELLHDRTQTANVQVVISYAQFKEVGDLFPESYDETISKRWGVDVRVSSSVFSLELLVPTKIAGSDYINNYTLIQDKGLATPQENYFHNIREVIQITPQNSIENVYMLPKSKTPAVDFISKNNDSGIIVKPMYVTSNSKKREVDTFRLHKFVHNITYRILDDEQHLDKPIKLQILLEVDRLKFVPSLNVQCVRWNRLRKCWTRSGCQTELPNYKVIKPEKLVINCTCYYVANYALLVDVVNYNEYVRPSAVVGLLYYISFPISFLITTIVLMSLSLLPEMQTNSNNIHRNFIINILLAEFFFFVGIQTGTSFVESDFSCKLIAIMLHYFWVSTFTWLSIDCIHLYRMLNEMRDINHESMGFYYTIGYGASAVLVGLSVGVRTHEYGNSQFCWLSLYETVVWWLIGPIAVMSIMDMFILFMSIKSAFSIKNHIVDFGNLKTFLWLSVICLPLTGLTCVLALLTASDDSELLGILLCIALITHSIFCLIAYCLINKCVRTNLRLQFFRCLGRKVPLLNTVRDHNDSSAITMRETQFIDAAFVARRNVGISASSTTSKSTGKSEPYRTERPISTTTSNYNSEDDKFIHSQLYTHNKAKLTHHGIEFGSASDSEVQSVELASSHSSDNEESKSANRRHDDVFLNTVPFHVDKKEYVQTTSPPVLNIVQSPQYFPNVVNKAFYTASSHTTAGSHLNEEAQENSLHAEKHLQTNPLGSNLKENTATRSHIYDNKLNNLELLSEKNLNEILKLSKCDSFDTYNSEYNASYFVENNFREFGNSSFIPGSGPQNIINGGPAQPENRNRLEYGNLDRTSIQSENIGYDFPYTAEEDHLHKNVAADGYLL